MRTDAAAGGRRTRAIAGLAGVLALLAAGCGSGTSPAPDATMAHHPMSSHSAGAPASATAAFGPDCAMVPATGMGSLHSMSMDPVVTAAAHNPLLTTFAADVKTSGLTGDLNSMHAVTVSRGQQRFQQAPGRADGHAPQHRGAGPILKYHVVSGRVTPAELASGMALTTLSGGTLKGAKMGSVYEVNGADVICGGIQTANATVYVINKVLTPGH